MLNQSLPLFRAQHGVNVLAASLVIRTLCHSGCYVPLATFAETLLVLNYS